MRYRIALFIILLIVLSYSAGYSQKSVRDSLHTLLSSSISDTLRLHLYDAIVEAESNYDSIEFYSKKMEALSNGRKNATGVVKDKFEHYYGTALNNLAVVEENKGNVPKALDLYTQSLQIFEKKEDITGQAMVVNNLGYVYRYQGNFTRALEFYERSLTLRKLSKDLKGEAIAITNIGIVVYAMGDIKGALNHYHDALKIYKQIGDKRGEGRILNNISGVYYSQGELNIAISHQQQSLKIAEEMGDIVSQMTVLNNLSSIYLDLKKISESLKTSEKSLVIATSLKDKINIGKILAIRGRAYDLSGDLQHAMADTQKAIDIYTELTNYPLMASAFNQMAELIEKSGDINKAHSYFQKSLTISQKINAPKFIRDAAKNLARLYKTQNKSREAFAMYELYIAMRDSLNNEGIRKDALKTQYKYEYALKAKADSIQIEEQKKVFHAQLSVEKTQRYGLIGGIVLLLIIAGFAFSQFKVRKRLEELKLRNQIASDLHDDVGSAISSISLFAGMARMKQGKAADELVEKIEETSRETMNNMSDIVWSIEPANDSFENVIKKMKHFGQQITNSLNMTFEFSCEPAIQRLSLDMLQRKNIYLIYKEAINNACKHSKGSLIKTILRKQDGNLNMTISDNGVGFDLNQDGLGHGIANLETRASTMRGKISIQSSPSEGTTICLILPLS
jgi:two-component system, NarL family, sensor histidine kinase UhpB